MLIFKPSIDDYKIYLNRLEQSLVKCDSLKDYIKLRPFIKYAAKLAYEFGGEYLNTYMKFSIIDHKITLNVIK